MSNYFIRRTPCEVESPSSFNPSSKRQLGPDDDGEVWVRLSVKGG